MSCLALAEELVVVQVHVPRYSSEPEVYRKSLLVIGLRASRLRHMDEPRTANECWEVANQHDFSVTDHAVTFNKRTPCCCIRDMSLLSPPRDGRKTDV